MKRISTLIILAMLSFYTANATITYTYNPQSFADTIRSIDLDGDSVADFAFYNGGVGNVLVQCLSSKSYYAGSIADQVPLAYQGGDSLGTFGWNSQDGSLENFGTQQAYLMVKIQADINTEYFGWFLISFTSAQPSIISYAFSDVPNVQIRAGEGDGVISSIREAKPANYGFDMIGGNILFKDCTGYDKVCFYNTNGQQLSEINAPIQQQQYSISINGAVIVTFFKNGRVAASTKQYVR